MSIASSEDRPGFKEIRDCLRQLSDESGHWLELIEAMPDILQSQFGAETFKELARLRQKASELTGVMGSSRKTAGGNNA